jgi:hypothetical protein
MPPANTYSLYTPYKAAVSHERFTMDTPVYVQRDEANASAAEAWQRCAELAHENERLRLRLSRAVVLLKQSCGLIVEFGDLNGFRNLSNDELGGLVVSVATAVGEFLNEVAPVTEAEKLAVLENRRRAR